MFSFFSPKLTTLSNHYVDWSRIGSLLRSGNHRYSTQEILTRGAIVSFTAASAFLGYYVNQSKKTGYSGASAALTAGLAGFVISHAFVIAPLIKKRLEISNKCTAKKNEILTKLPLINNKSIEALVVGVIDHIGKFSLSDKEHHRASETWGKRLSLLTQVNDSFLLPREEFSTFWTGNIDSMMEKFLTPTENQRYNFR